VTHDAYRTLAAHYDRLRMDWYTGTTGPQLVELLAAHGVRDGAILDAGCGTGTLAMWLATRGFAVDGVDLSPSLLAQAKAKAVAASQNVRFELGDITDLSLSHRFDAVVCVADVLNHLPTLDDWERAFRSFAQHLRPGGLLFFDALTALGLERMDMYEVHDLANGALMMGIIYEPAAHRSTLKLTCYVPVPGTSYFERASETIPEWAQPVGDVLARLQRSGFESIEQPWRATGEPENEERLTVLAVRSSAMVRADQ
jgi:2-polyprenyl-3-methyl-5-hydroxy-6-metoxy-1,4-benzoquinol methylase